MKQINFRLEDEIYTIIDQYRYSKTGEFGRATWDKLVLSALILAMLKDGFAHSDKVIEYATRPAKKKK
jgi:hypothetical protein